MIIHRSEICGHGETQEDAEIAWKRNVRRVMRALHRWYTVKHYHKMNVELDDAAIILMNFYNAATDPSQQTPWPQSILEDVTQLDRIENSYPKKL